MSNTSILSLLTILALSSSLPLQALAESPRPQCMQDAECVNDTVCVWERCVPVASICEHSDDCQDGLICDLAQDTCPAQCEVDCPERCDKPSGLCEAPPTTPCTSDIECPEDQLCWLSFNPGCAEEDSACEEASRTNCAIWGNFCTTPGVDDLSCMAGYVCDQLLRCVPEGSESISETITVDDDKASRVAAAWRASIEDEDEGCASGPVNSPLFAGLLLLTLLALNRRTKGAHQS